ncbi:MAG: ankyrin repeat domain-containing protein [Alphaproteobacteria bacterium]|nr:ankyrin repeat domain-containing protein [Alphaproteobacteria bacterium]
MTQQELNDKLFEAVKNDDLDQVKELISNGADANAQTFNECPVLVYASDPAIAEFLIEHGADVNHMNDSGITPLHDAIFENNIDVVRVLIKHGANVNSNTSPDIVDQIYKEFEELPYPNKADTPLHWAAGKDNCEFAKILIENGADVNLVDARGQTPLHQVYNVETAQLLIDHGADVNAIDSNGWTPLFYAPDVNIAKILVENGADISIKDKYGWPALDMIVNTMVEDLNTTRPEYHKLQEIVNYLVPLYRAKGLISTQLELNKALFESIANKNVYDVESMVIMGADIDAVNKNGETPLELAQRKLTEENLSTEEKQKIQSVIDYLKSLGAEE